MDGLFRAEGIIVFMTTNNIQDLDEALVRSSRIDYKLEYTYADEYQIKSCFNYYFPNQIDKFDKFYSKIEFNELSIADLQVFFFKYRKCQNILEHVAEFKTMISNKKKEKEGSLYT
jgi:SpoVK/Ycf46/Vps4 family AAA+-type ATPase